jgi:hypothetical protein
MFLISMSLTLNIKIDYTNLKKEYDRWVGAQYVVPLRIILCVVNII